MGLGISLQRRGRVPPVSRLLLRESVCERERERVNAKEREQETFITNLSRAAEQGNAGAEAGRRFGLWVMGYGFWGMGYGV